MNKFEQALEDNKKVTLKSIEEGISYKKQIGNGENKHLALNPFENKLMLESQDGLIKSDTNRNALISQQNKASYPEDNLSFKKLSKQSFDNFDVYVQENKERKGLIKTRQEEARVKTILKNKHVYRAKNYYNNNNLENVFYERDAHLERSMRFQNKINKNE
jgi:hypothetical protein